MGQALGRFRIPPQFADAFRIRRAIVRETLLRKVLHSAESALFDLEYLPIGSGPVDHWLFLASDATVLSRRVPWAAGFEG